MDEVGAAYAGCRARVAELAKGLDEARAQTLVPACPEWSVHDVVAHLAGVVDDALAGRLEGVATEPWTAAQVQARRTRPIADILAEWEETAPAFEELLDAIGAPGRQAVTDAVTHEQDIRGALGVPGAKNADAVRIGVGFLAPALVDGAARRGVSLHLRSHDGLEFGAKPAQVVLTGASFDLLRAMTGRRSADQVREMLWDGDVEKVLPVFTFGPFRPATNRIEE